MANFIEEAFSLVNTDLVHLNQALMEKNFIDSSTSLPQIIFRNSIWEQNSTTIIFKNISKEPIKIPNIPNDGIHDLVIELEIYMKGECDYIDTHFRNPIAFPKSFQEPTFIFNLQIRYQELNEASDIVNYLSAWHLDKNIYEYKITDEFLQIIKDRLHADEYKVFHDKKNHLFKTEDEFNSFITDKFNLTKKNVKNLSFGNIDDMLTFLHKTIRFSNFSHPEFHLHYSGNKMFHSGYKFGQTLLMESPRIQFPPMDIVLAIDFILKNFYSEEQRRDIENSPNFDYNAIMERAKLRMWRPYYLAIAMHWLMKEQRNLPYQTNISFTRDFLL
jgi:hypothetical protein